MHAVVVLAAGMGTRMLSSKSKVLHKIGGQEILFYVIKSAFSINPKEVILIRPKDFIDHPLLTRCKCVVQDPPEGTGAAVKEALSYINDDIKDILILTGDTPLTEKNTLEKVLNKDGDFVLTCFNDVKESETYGRVLCDDKGKPKAIIEWKDASDKERSITLANGGIYKVKRDILEKYLPKLKKDNKSKEYYFTDIVKEIYKNAGTTDFVLASRDELLGINTRSDLCQAEGILQKRLRQKVLKQGVTLVEPGTVFFSYDTHVGNDSYIEPFVTFGPNVHINEEVIIKSFSHIEYANIKKCSVIGPFAHIRGDSDIGEKNHIGNFVEIKGSKTKRSTKIKHLSYIGDSDIGANVNIGAGAITCNYNGFQKSKTIIKDDVMVGANSSLIAPIVIEKGAIIGAGSTISKSIPEDALVVERSKTVINHGKAKIYRKKKTKKKEDT
ncbi:MAG: bifunctional UDP-N-acetylglucosamine diphosphorylase/glucosamine-1-phosphate N-acetyltransferase GlmU [Alphaproteobacteria bacterium]